MLYLEKQCNLALIYTHLGKINNKISNTQKNISNKLGISRSYVSRIEKRALTKLLREFLKEKKK